jgi:hypothetical protein
MRRPYSLISAVAILIVSIVLTLHYADGRMAARVFAGILSLCAAIALGWSWVSSKPDDDRDDALMSLAARRFLVLYLICAGLVLAGGIAFLSWFDFTPLDSSHNPIQLSGSNATLKPAPYGWIRLPDGGLLWLSLNMQLLLLATAAGALGSYIHAIKSLADFLGNRTAKASWYYFYITRPFLGGALALLFYAVIRGGFMTGSPADASSVSPYGVIAVCGLVGMFADRASQKLSEVFDTLFRTEDARQDKLAGAEPSRLDPDTVPVNGQVREITVRGTNLGETDRVRVNGADRKPKSATNEAVIFVLTDTEVATRRSFTIQLVSKSGGQSKPLTLHVSDLALTTQNLPNVTVGAAYGPVQMAATGGTGAGTYKWVATGLPKGIALNRDSGELGGQAEPNTQGVFHVVVVVQDADGANASRTFPLTVTN